MAPGMPVWLARSGPPAVTVLAAARWPRSFR